MSQIVLPELGDGIEKAVVACIFKKAGDPVKIDEDVAEVVTDKATFSITSEIDGFIEEICVKQGDEVEIGTSLVKLQEKQ